MTRYKAGHIVLVRFPFADLTTTKKRPGLVVSPLAFTARQGDVVVLAITSQPQKDGRLAWSTIAAYHSRHARHRFPNAITDRYPKPTRARSRRYVRMFIIRAEGLFRQVATPDSPGFFPNG